MLVSLILAALFAAPAPPLPLTMPTPTPTPGTSTPFYPVIMHTVTTETCATLDHLMLPVGFVARRNDAAIATMALSTQKFLSHFMPGDVPTAADVQAALGNSNGSSPNLNGTGTALSTSESSSQEDDSLVYGPGQILNASRIDALAQQIYINIKLERDYLKTSEKDYPPGSNPKVDALRARAEGLIELQSALADRYEQFAGTYLDSMGVAGMTSQNASDLATFKITLRGLLLGDTNGLASYSPDGNDSENGGFSSVAELAKDGTPGQVVSGLRAVEYSFASSVLATYDQCRGTHYILAPPKRPAPSPSPRP